MSQKRLLPVFAHPDDESFGVGGTLARYAAEGCRVRLVTATRGEAGQIQGSGAKPANLPQLREAELRCACRTYGLGEPILLDYIDGQLPIVHQGQAVGKLVRILRQFRPQVLLTFGPDGIYGHYDHIAVHRWSTIAVRLAADAACYPDDSVACEPHQVLKVYHAALTQSQLAAMGNGADEPSVPMDGVPFPLVAYPDAQITTVIDVSRHARVKLAGIACHRTQLGDDHPYLQDPASALANPWFTHEAFVRAMSRVPAPEHEDDLFAGIDPSAGGCC